jgi:hypothetical protein
MGFVVYVLMLTYVSIHQFGLVFIISSAVIDKLHGSIYRYILDSYQSKGVYILCQMANL